VYCLKYGTLLSWFLADRTNGRAMLQCCVRLSPSSSVALCRIVAKRCVLERNAVLYQW